MVYITVYSKCKWNAENVADAIDVKRKGEETEEIDEESLVEKKEDCETDPNRRCVDLIVLGISYRSLETDVKKCFEAFGELIFCEVNCRSMQIVRFDSTRVDSDQKRRQWAIAWFRFYSF